MITDVKTGNSVNFYFRKVEHDEITDNQYRPTGGWDFDWLKPITHSFEVYGLVTKNFSHEIQGLIALMPNYDPDFKCVDIEIIESAPANKKIVNGLDNPNRRYDGIGKCLVAFACQYSLDKELEGFVELTSKTSKLDFYLNLGGTPTYGQNVMFSKHVAKHLSKKYFPGGIQWWKK